MTAVSGALVEFRLFPDRIITRQSMLRDNWVHIPVQVMHEEPPHLQFMGIPHQIAMAERYMHQQQQAALAVSHRERRDHEAINRHASNRHRPSHLRRDQYFATGREYSRHWGRQQHGTGHHQARINNYALPPNSPAQLDMSQINRQMSALALQDRRRPQTSPRSTSPMLTDMHEERASGTSTPIRDCGGGGGGDDRKRCVVCLESEANTLIMNCRHVKTCYACTERVQITGGRCPYCRNPISYMLKVFV